MSDERLVPATHSSGSEGDEKRLDRITHSLARMSLTEFGILAFTNDSLVIEAKKRSEIKRKQRQLEPVVLTTKNAYRWAATVAAILKTNPELDVGNVIAAYRYALEIDSPELRLYYRDPIVGSDFENRIFSRLSNSFIDLLVRSKSGVNQIEIRRELEKAYHTLLKRDLIEDPLFFEAMGIVFTVVGFIPYGFTQRTEDGRTLYRNIEALFWTYEMEHRGEARQVRLHFRLWKILTALKKALAQETNELSSEPDEPAAIPRYIRERRLASLKKEASKRQKLPAKRTQLKADWLSKYKKGDRKR